MGPNPNGPLSLSKLRSSYDILRFFRGSVRSVGPVGDFLDPRFFESDLLIPPLNGGHFSPKELIKVTLKNKGPLTR